MNKLQYTEMYWRENNRKAGTIAFETTSLTIPRITTSFDNAAQNKTKYEPSPKGTTFFHTKRTLDLLFSIATANIELAVTLTDEALLFARMAMEFCRGYNVYCCAVLGGAGNR